MEKFKKGDLVIYIGNMKEYYGKLFEVSNGPTKKDLRNGKLIVFVKHPASWFFSLNLLKICNINRKVKEQNGKK